MLPITQTQTDSIAAVQDPARLAALQQVALLDTPAEAAFDRLTHLATEILGVPVALVSLVDRDRQFFKSAVGLPEPWASCRETPLSHSFCQHTVASGQPLVIADARLHPFLYANLAIPELGVVAYAGIPLNTSDGYGLGSFCVIDHQPRVWTAREIAILRDLAALTLNEIEFRTAARQRAELLAQEQQRADDYLRLQQEFIALVSHELKTPLTVIRGQAELLQRRGGAGAVRAGEVIQEQARQLQRLIDDLLDVSQLEAHRLTLRREQVDLLALIRAAAEQAQGLAPAHTVRVEAAMPTLVGSWDPARVRQVLDNLLSNAVKYAPGGGEVVVRVADGGHEACIAVADPGVGIAAADLPRLFQRFSRLAEASTLQVEGTGLGLYISKSLVEAFGGRIWAESAVGMGTTLHFTLPYAAPGGA